ncbi:MAG: 2,4-diaminopentanoate dehydrogenase [Acholeplasmatales bacterium]|jgi:4-hydroxy-tetrahydrodipicolinate reductase|nr:2,4-diaminopentanoate dehydrogenase [Acholeplasmataceae bacterium]MCK9289396.1 2,4-diaminopentanoate dehydrogenase [Acholeplasmataceae bacterium]MCK9428108.1 2,4-diaminopentanoate dehydrogenase [Acholeplasmataceae bacterium]MDY0115020.1 2,4-diaminopentanoate dehydrogenase [Acholeplasmatales bacterium]HHT39973.1 Gfo/Idh/MocA family oxidoreductase [Acholeplasmataceae bacterium]
MEKVKILIWGFGAMGRGMAEMLLTKKGVEIVAICDIDPLVVNKGFLDVLNVKTQHENVIISDNIDELLADNKIDLVLLTTDSFTKNNYPKIVKIVEKGINVISTAEEMAYPYVNQPELAKKMDVLAKKHQATILGTGINPGFVMDLLVVALTGAMMDVKEIEAKRVNSLSPFGKTVMSEQGVGLSLEEYQEKMKKGALAGHVGFKESVHLIAEGLGVKLTDFKEQMAPIITKVDLKSKYGEAKKGHLAGIDMKAQGFLNNQAFIKMIHPQQIEPEKSGINTGDYITLKGTPNIKMSINPEISGGVGTIAVCVNMIPHVINAKPGLKTMLDLPVPRAILGDMRELIEKD